MAEQSFEELHRVSITDIERNERRGRDLPVIYLEDAITAHLADRQAYALEVLKVLVNHPKALYSGEPHLYGIPTITLPVEAFDQAIQKINQDLGREV